MSILFLTLLHSERPKLYTILAFLSATGLYSEILPLYEGLSKPQSGMLILHAVDVHLPVLGHKNS